MKQQKTLYTAKEYQQLLQKKQPKQNITAGQSFGSTPIDTLPSVSELYQNSVLVFEVQWDFPTLNEVIAKAQRSPFAYNKLKQKIEKQLVPLFQQMVQFHRFQVPIQHKVRVHCLWFVNSRAKDGDNVAASKKFILDALVAAGVLLQDNLTKATEYEDSFTIDRQNQRVRIHIQKPKYNLI